MKIALVIADLNIRGGTHKQLVRLAEFLKAQGCDISLHTFIYEPSKCYPGTDQFPIHEIRRNMGRSRLRNTVLSLWASLRLVLSIPKDVDIINVHDMGCFYVIYLVKLLRARAKLIWQINDLPAAYHVGPHKNLAPHWTDPVIRLFVWSAAHLCDAITVNVGKNQLLVSELVGVKPELFYPGVDQISAGTHSRSLSTPLRLLSVGVFFPYRNYEVIVNAMELLRSRGLPTELTIVGSTALSPQYAEKIERMARDKGLHVEITGEVNEKRFEEIFLQSHLFLFVNLDQSWGLAVFEALNQSLPVIVSKSAGAVELLDRCKGARIVDATSAEAVADAIAEVSGDPELHAAMSSAGFAFSQTLTWDNLYSSKVLELFERLLSASHGRNGDPRR